MLCCTQTAGRVLFYILLILPASLFFFLFSVLASRLRLTAASSCFLSVAFSSCPIVFCFNDTAITVTYTLTLPDALPFSLVAHSGLRGFPVCLLLLRCLP